MTVDFSIIIPARNEEQNLPRCLDSIKAAQVLIAPQEVEVVVVINRCTDATEAIALEYGCKIVHEEARNLSKIRNRGLFAASGQYLITIDADSRMSKDYLRHVSRVVSSGQVAGGGGLVFPERWSVGIACTGLCLILLLLWYRSPAGLYFVSKEVLHQVGGFNEALASVEDLDFGRRIRQYAHRNGLRFMLLPQAWVITSCRKFDTFGEWHFFSNPLRTLKILKGTSQKEADRYWYEVER